MPDVIFKEWSYKRGPGYLFGREEDGVSDEEQNIAQDFLKTFLKSGNTRDPTVLQNMFGPSIWAAPTIHTAELLSMEKKSPTSPRSNELLRHREGIVVEDTQFSCVIY